MSHDALPDKLVYMANQISKFFVSQGDAVAVAGTAEHIKKFWDPRMLKAIFAHLDKGGAGLEPVAHQAIEQLQQAAVKA
jgi:formate dehydrogenase subunit delta